MARPPLSPAARDDLEQILTYLDERSQSAADRFAKAIDNVIARIGKLPRIGRDRSELRPGLRSVVIGDFVLFYRVQKKRVEIVRILHGARDIPTALDEG